MLLLLFCFVFFSHQNLVLEDKGEGKTEKKENQQHTANIKSRYKKHSPTKKKKPEKFSFRISSSIWFARRPSNFVNGFFFSSAVARREMEIIRQ